MIKRSDDLIKLDIEKRLKADSSLDDSSITVRSVYKGDVVLSGKATSLNDYQRALYCAATAPGVDHVASEIEVVQHAIRRRLPYGQSQKGGDR